MSVGKVVAVARDGKHRFSKNLAAEIQVTSGLGVEDDAHLAHPIHGLEVVLLV